MHLIKTSCPQRGAWWRDVTLPTLLSHTLCCRILLGDASLWCCMCGGVECAPTPRLAAMAAAERIVRSVRVSFVAELRRVGHWAFCLPGFGLVVNMTWPPSKLIRASQEQVAEGALTFLFRNERQPGRGPRIGLSSDFCLMLRGSKGQAKAWNLQALYRPAPLLPRRVFRSAA